MIEKSKKRVTRNDVAKLAGVSGTVVSDVLNQRPDARVSEQTRKKVFSAAKKLNYKPHGIAQRLVTGKTLNISFAIYDLNTIVFQPWSRILLGISKTANNFRYNVDLAVTNSSLSDQSQFSYKRKMQERMTDGFLIYDSRITDEEIIEIIEAGFPVVLIDRELKEKSVPHVCNDYARSIQIAVDCLRNLGHNNWAFVGATNLDERFYNFVNMYNAAKSLWQQQGLSNERCLLIPPHEEIDAAEYIEDFLEKNPQVTAFICWTDGYAARINTALTRLNKQVPKDFSIIGMNNELYCQYLTPSLTTVDIKREIMGEYAAQSLIQTLEGHTFAPSERMVEPELIIRDSVTRNEKLT